VEHKNKSEDSKVSFDILMFLCTALYGMCFPTKEPLLHIMQNSSKYKVGFKKHERAYVKELLVLPENG
jgi:hypothetical protein